MSYYPTVLRGCGDHGEYVENQTGKKRKTYNLWCPKCNAKRPMSAKQALRMAKKHLDKRGDDS
jgi:ribosomal protein L40E